MLGVGLGAPRGPPGLTSPSSSEVPVVHSETGFDWQRGDGQSATSHSLAYHLPDSQSRRLEGWKASPCVPLGDREAASPEGQKVVLRSLPVVLQALRKAVHSWLKSRENILVSFLTASPKKKGL